MNTKAIFTFHGVSKVTLIAASAISALGFTWPFFINEKVGHPQWLFAIATAFSLLTLLVSVSSKELDSKSVALLAVLTALIAALRPLGTGAVGIEPMWFVLILSARVFGPSFGFLLGTLSMLLSALLTGGIGPWLGYQCFAAGWIGLGIALVPKKARGKKEIALLVVYSIIAAEFFGILMDLQFWPWSLGSASQLSYQAGAALHINLYHFLSYHFLSSMAWDIPRALFTSVFIVVAGRPILEALRRTYSRAAFVTPIEFTSEREKASKATQQ